MPPAQLTVPRIKVLLGNLTNAQYNRALYRFIVSIGMYHLWYYDSQDWTLVWSIIFRLIHNIIPTVVPAPGPAVVIPHGILMGVFHLFIVCEKHLISNKNAIYNAYREEYDRCALAGYDAYTCHQWGVYAGNLLWAATMLGIPMGVALPDLPTLTLPPPYLWSHDGRRPHPERKRAPAHPSCPSPILPTNDLRTLGGGQSGPNVCWKLPAPAWKLEKQSPDCRSCQHGSCASSR